MKIIGIYLAGKVKNLKINDKIEFMDLSRDTDGTITKRLWNFGDGIISELNSSTHKYTDNRTFIVTLTVWDDNESMNSTY